MKIVQGFEVISKPCFCFVNTRKEGTSEKPGLWIVT